MIALRVVRRDARLNGNCSSDLAFCARAGDVVAFAIIPRSLAEVREVLRC